MQELMSGVTLIRSMSVSGGGGEGEEHEVRRVRAEAVSLGHRLIRFSSSVL